MPLDPLTIEDIPGPDGKRILRLKGPILISNLFDFQKRVRSNTEPALIIDFTGCPYIDSAGIGALVGAQVNHQKDGRSLVLVGVCERIRHALEVTHVESLFVFDESSPAEQAS